MEKLRIYALAQGYLQGNRYTVSRERTKKARVMLSDFDYCERGGFPPLQGLLHYMWLSWEGGNLNTGIMLRAASRYTKDI
jgi:hypothetical protein